MSREEAVSAAHESDTLPSLCIPFRHRGLICQNIRGRLRVEWTGVLSRKPEGSGPMNLFRRLAIVALILAFTCINSAEAAKRPNILLAISDDQAYPFASAYGYKAVNTPAFDRLAASGVLFRNCFAGSPGCAPSRAALPTD